MGFSPFELVYGYQPQGLLDVVCEGWEEQRTLGTTLLEHMIQLRERLQRVQQIARKNLLEGQVRQKSMSDKIIK